MFNLDQSAIKILKSCQQMVSSKVVQDITGHQKIPPLNQPNKSLLFKQQWLSVALTTETIMSAGSEFYISCL